MFRPPNLAAASILLYGVAFGCGGPSAGENPDLPPLEWEGDRIMFGTTLVEEVCVGTLESFDATVESIEADLGLEPSNDKIAIYLLEDDKIEELCGPPLVACVKGGKVHSSSSGLDSMHHELVHARLIQQGILGKPMFDEGIASALDKGGGCLASEACAAADLEALLSATTPQDLWEFDGYTAGADLVHGMLEDHGPEAVLAFMSELNRETAPDEIRALYLEHFGAVIDEDFHAYMRGAFDDYTLAQRGCDGLLFAPSAVDGEGIEVHGTMDCSSPEVINSFVDPLRGSIEWTFIVPPDQAGAFVVSSSSANELLLVRGCHPPPFGANELADLGPYTFAWSSSSGDDTLLLAAGQYTVRWPSEIGSSVDFVIAPPCTFEAGGCPEGQQCTIWNECISVVDSPAEIGSPCEPEAEGPLVCEAGSRCLGGLCVAECDATRSCGVGQACTRQRVCGPICDLLEQDCAFGFTCLPSSEEDLNASEVGACVAAGEGELFATCDERESSCQAGLSCEGVGPFPNEAPCYGQPGGCCAPFCDPNAADPGCPVEAPTCDPIQDGSVGVCRA